MKDSDAHTPNVSKVHRFVKTPPTQRQEPDAAEALDSYEKAHAVTRNALVLEVRLANGDTVSFPYSSFRKAKYFTKGRLEVRFDDDLIIAEGKNLHQLKDAINQHSLRFMKEGTDTDLGQTTGDAVHIDHLEIREREEES